MNERQLKLKSILDQYATFTMTIEDVEARLGQVFRNESRESFERLVIDAQQQACDVTPIVYLKATRTLTESYVKALREQWNDAHKGAVRLFVLNHDLEIVDGNTVHADQVTAKIGSFEFAFDQSGASPYVCKLDGIDLKNVTKLTIHVDKTKRPLVKFEAYAL